MKQTTTQHETDKKSTPIPIWSEYSNYHDYLIELLSYGRKSNYGKQNIWEYEYV